MKDEEDERFTEAGDVIVEPLSEVVGAVLGVPPARPGSCSSWETVCTDRNAGVKRFSVPGGWLYRTQVGWRDSDQLCEVVFVPDPELS